MFTTFWERSQILGLIKFDNFAGQVRKEGKGSIKENSDGQERKGNWGRGKRMKPENR